MAVPFAHQCAAQLKSAIRITAQKRYYGASSPVFRRRGPLLSPADRLVRFGRYELILPRPGNLTGEILRQDRRTSVPDHIPRPEYDQETGQPVVVLTTPHLKSGKEVDGMRKACKLARRILDIAKATVNPGVTTDAIDQIVHQEIVRHSAYPSPLNYNGFPKSLCTSINNVICHGIPDDRPLRDGDIINLDITVYLEGFHGDCSETVVVGNVDEKGKNLVRATKEAMEKAISICKPGVPLNTIGRVISEHASATGYTTSPDFCGHGIGRHFHEPPLIYHSENNRPGVMQEGMTFTIEPILMQGKPAFLKWPDNWTAVTQDGGRSAQFEHTILLVPGGVEVLT